MPQTVGRMLDCEDEKLTLDEGNLGFEAKLEGVDEEDGEVVRSRVTVGKRGLEEFGK